MELKEVIEKRRTIRDFRNIPVPLNIIRYAIENAFKAPSYNHFREWDFILIHQTESKLKLIEAEDLVDTFTVSDLEKEFENRDDLIREMYVDAIPKQKKMILTAPSVVVVVFKPKTRVDEAKTVYDLNCLASVWACIENFLLSLAEHDIYGVTYIPQKIRTIKEKLGIPDELEIAAIIPIGYKSEDAKILKQKSINPIEHIHSEKW